MTISSGSTYATSNAILGLEISKYQTIHYNVFKIVLEYEDTPEQHSTRKIKEKKRKEI